MCQVSKLEGQFLVFDDLGKTKRDIDRRSRSTTLYIGVSHLNPSKPSKDLQC